MLREAKIWTFKKNGSCNYSEKHLILWLIDQRIYFYVFKILNNKKKEWKGEESTVRTTSWALHPDVFLLLIKLKGTHIPLNTYLYNLVTLKYLWGHILWSIQYNQLLQSKLVARLFRSLPYQTILWFYELRSKHKTWAKQFQPHVDHN